MFRSKLFCALLVGASVLVAAQAKADLSLKDRDWAGEALAAGFWEQTDQVEQLVRAGKPDEARELLASMQARLKALQQRVEVLAKTAEAGPIRSASW